MQVPLDGRDRDVHDRYVSQVSFVARHELVADLRFR
jgi:hypothetical protein